MMDLTKLKDVEIEIKEISDKEIRPDNCMSCGHVELKIASHVFHDLWDLGSPGVARILRHEKITWECKNCHDQFMVLNQSMPFNTSYTDEIKEYDFGGAHVREWVLDVGRCTGHDNPDRVPCTRQCWSACPVGLKKK